MALPPRKTPSLEKQKRGLDCTQMENSQSSTLKSSTSLFLRNISIGIKLCQLLSKTFQVSSFHCWINVFSPPLLLPSSRSPFPILAAPRCQLVFFSDDELEEPRPRTVLLCRFLLASRADFWPCFRLSFCALILISWSDAKVFSRPESWPWDRVI